MRLKRETQGAFCVLNANANSQTRKSMKINVICTVHIGVTFDIQSLLFPYYTHKLVLASTKLITDIHNRFTVIA